MSRYRDISLVLDDWLAQGPAYAPDRVIDRVLTEVRATPQRSAWPRLGRLSVDTIAGLSAAAVLVIAMSATIVLTLAQADRPAGPPGGTTLPVSSPTASPTASPMPLRPEEPMLSDVEYSVPGFQPAVTLRDLPGWRLVRPASARSQPGEIGEFVLESPAGTSVVVMRPNEAVEAGGQPIIAAPSFIDSWLWTRGELTFTRTSPLLDVPPEIVVGGWQGRDLEGSVVADAAANVHGQVVLLCAPEYPCSADSEDQLAVRPGDHFRIVVLNVGGAGVVIGVSTDPARWEEANADFNDFLGDVGFSGY